MMVQQSEMSGYVERRGQPRYKLKDGVLAFLGSIPCSIMDISQSGMAVNYVVLSEQEIMPLHYDLFSSEKMTYLTNIPGVLVAQSDPLPAASYSVLQTKRLSIKFDPLPGEQLCRLTQFITENSIDNA